MNILYKQKIWQELCLDNKEIWALDFAPNLKAEGKLLADITKLSIQKIEIWKVKLDKKSWPCPFKTLKQDNLELLNDLCLTTRVKLRLP